MDLFTFDVIDLIECGFYWAWWFASLKQHGLLLFVLPWSPVLLVFHLFTNQLCNHNGDENATAYMFRHASIVQIVEILK